MAFLSSSMSCLLFLQLSPPAPRLPAAASPQTPPSPHPAELPRSSPVTHPQEEALDSPGNSDQSCPLQFSRGPSSQEASKPDADGIQIEGKRENENESSVMAGDSKSIDGSRSESMVSEVSFGSEDGASLDEEGISQSASPSGRLRRRDVLKNQIKDISKQIKQGGIHLQEEGEKHLQTVVASINRQAQELNQSGKFCITPSPSSHGGTAISKPSAFSQIDEKSASEAVVCTTTPSRKSGTSSEEASKLDADEKLLQEGSATIINDTTDVLDSPNFLPSFIIGVEIEHKIGDANESLVMASDSKSVSDSRSESMLSEVSEEGASLEEEGISKNTSSSGWRGRRNLLKNPIKGISKQMKQGRLHLQEEGEKQLQTVLASINRQVEEVDQSGKFCITPRMSKN